MDRPMGSLGKKVGRSLLALILFISADAAFGDGMVMTERVYPKALLPNQRALLHFANGKETLVIETTFLAEGTNFAWVVPLPSAPEIKPVSQDLFNGLARMFTPALVD